MEMTVEIDEQKVLDNMGSDEIFTKSGMDTSNCKVFFGDKLLAEFTVADIIAYWGEDRFLNEIGQEVAIAHFGIEVAE